MPPPLNLPLPGRNSLSVGEGRGEVINYLLYIHLKINIMSKIIYIKFIFILLAALLVSCKDEEATSTRISLEADKLQVNVGDPVTFTINHNAMAVAIFTGEKGHDYQTSAAFLLDGKNKEDIENNNYRPVDPAVVPYNCDLSKTEAGASTIADDLMEVRDANGGWSLIGTEAEVVADPTLQKNVLKVASKNPDWWYQALRFNINSRLGTNKNFTLRMRFEKDILEEIYSGEQHPEITTFPVVIRLGGKGAGDTDVTFSDATVWDIYWNPNLEYTDYSVDLTRIIAEWQTATGKTMTELSYIQILFTSNGSIGYVGDYFVESATYGDIDYIPFSTAYVLPVSDKSGHITYQYSYSTSGTYKVVVIGNNVGFKKYSGDGYKDDRGETLGANEYDYSTQMSTLEIVVSP